MEKFYLHCPGNSYDLQLYDCNTIEEAEKRACQFLGVDELPEDCYIH